MVRHQVVYFPSWSCYREGLGKFSVKKMGPCNTAVYSFASMHPETFQVYLDDPPELYEEFIGYCKENEIRPILGVGGWVDSDGKYSRMLANADNREKFIRSAVRFIKKHGFEGLNLDIEYPTCPQGNRNEGSPDDRKGFTRLIRQLKQDFRSDQLELSAAIPAQVPIIKQGYNVKKVFDYLDWVGVMTYDYHVSSGCRTGPISSIQDTEETIKCLLELGGRGREGKMVVGVPFYGQSYRLTSSSHVGYDLESRGKGFAGKYTKEEGFFAYYEICELVKEKGYKMAETSKGACAYKDDIFISYNSKNDIQKKIDLIKRWELGGWMVWDASMDDFTGKFCYEGRNPLLQLLHDGS